VSEWLTSWETGWLVVAGLASVLLIWRLGVRFRRWRERLRRDDRLSRAMAGEEAAERMLERRGYRICDTQITRTWEIHRGDEPVDVELRADALVERDNRRFVAEVKTGRDAPELRVAATRRQLLEYRIAYEVDGILLVDVESGSIDQIDFGVCPDRV